MTQARKRLVSLCDTPYYHCVSRCVRRAFLCGKDPVTAYDFEHRRQWIVDRLQLLTGIFAVDLCAYAVMSNHYHVVVRINAEDALAWTAHEVAERWTDLFTGPWLVRRWLAGDVLDQAEHARVDIYVEEWRQRLMSLSWFMRCLNEPIARMANAEDRCTGRFWEGRFKSQALLDERALLSCMAYVDLNPLRAAIARTPETSDYTSIQQRIENPDGHALRPFCGHSDDTQGIPYQLKDYLELVDWAGRAIRHAKKGYISPHVPPLLARIGLVPEELTHFLKNKQDFPRVLGPLDRIRQMASTVGAAFFKDVSVSRRLFRQVG